MDMVPTDLSITAAVKGKYLSGGGGGDELDELGELGVILNFIPLSIELNENWQFVVVFFENQH